MSFDEIIDRRGTHCSKWDAMEKNFGVSPRDGIAMWIADMEFAAAPPIQDAIAAMHDHGIYGYFGDDSKYRAAIQWWMSERHGWRIEPEWIFSTAGLVNGFGVCVDTFTGPDDAVVLMTPVYHAFHRVLKAAGREIRECALARDGDRYGLDIDTWDSQMTGNERVLVLCSPHNPGGRVWTASELRAIAAFARRHELLVISDEVHHDLVFPGRSHVPTHHIDGIEDRLIVMTAPSKTFNIAGAHTGQVIIPDAELRGLFARRMAALSIEVASFGHFMTTAAYTPEGAEWVDRVVSYIDGNRRLFDARLSRIPGLRSMPLEATYLAWVDFSGTGMSREDFTARVQSDARLAVSHGRTFGKGGEDFLRFNIACARPQLEEALDRLAAAFADLQ